VRLLFAMLARHRMRMTLVMALSASSAILSVTLLDVIQSRLLAQSEITASNLGQYAGLLLLLFAIEATSHVAVATLGHRIVYELRRTFVKRVLDTSVERLEHLGSARILASLSGDTARLTVAFSAVPQIIYGSVLTLASFGYLVWLSRPLFAAIFVWLLLTVAVGLGLLRGMHQHMLPMRDLDDCLIADYETVIRGRSELGLNRQRARRVYQREFDPDARAYCDHATRFERYAGLNDAWLNAMVFGSIGFCFFVARRFGWAPTSVAATYAMAILFLRSPITNVIITIPMLVGGSVALERVRSLEIAEYTESFDRARERIPADWRAIHLESLTYRYASAFDENAFAIGPVNVTLRRGEIVFVIGGNGGGKSTFARLLTGLYRPHGGCIRVDDTVVDDDHRSSYRGLFAAVFSDFHLFRYPIIGAGAPAAPEAVRRWLDILDLGPKIAPRGDGSIDTHVSQGQRKRLALMLALLEERPLLMLDEWAADQDPAFRSFFYTRLLPELRSRGVTIVAITHDERYFNMADRILKLENGILIEQAKAARTTGRDQERRAR